ncbi:MAG: TraB/GumN family protein [Halanaerobiales bacterium]
MEEYIERLEYEGKEIILIATAHVSKKSVELVKKVIDEEQPDSVCVELDQMRYQNIKNPKKWEKTDIVKVIKSKKAGFMLINLALSSYQKRLAKKLKTKVGQEMIQGIESAEETDAKLVLADRNIQTTFRRIWRKLSFWEKLKLLFGILFSFADDTEISDEDLQELLQKDMLESVMSEMHNEFPRIGEILLNERDQYLAYKIKNAPGTKVVAVLGGAHVPGVKKEIYKEQDLDRITRIPPKKPIAKIIGWLIPIIILSLIVYSFIVNIQTGLQQVKIWILWNGIFSALFTAISFGHPFSIITAFLIAPISSLNPLLAAGWFVGLVEASIRKPTVEDVNNIPVDIFTLKGFFKNRFLRILLLVIMANIGSVIGTMLAGLDIIQNLF